MKRECKEQLFIILELKIPLQILLVSQLICGCSKMFYLNYHTITVYKKGI